jgi:hypothetical protein
MTTVYMPGIPLKFVERDGKKILQQVWIKHGFDPDKGWVPLEDHKWLDVPLEVEPFTLPKTYWVKGEL